MNNKIKLFFLSTIISQIIYSQNNSYFNDFFDNSNFNSTYNTLNKGLKVSFLGYKNLNAAYSPGYFSLNTSYTNKSNLNIGVRLINKSLQFENYYQLDAIIGHRLAITSNDSLGLSLNFGGVMNSFNSSYFNQYTEIDPFIDQYNRSYFNSGSSILYTHKNIFELGVSSPILVNSTEGLKPIMFFNSAYNYYDKEFIVRPQIIYELNNYSNFFDFSLQLKYQTKYWLKFSYNTLQSSMYGIGLNFKLIDIGYAYKLNANYFGKVQNNLHMISITIRH